MASYTVGVMSLVLRFGPRVLYNGDKVIVPHILDIIEDPRIQSLVFLSVDSLPSITKQKLKNTNIVGYSKPDVLSDRSLNIIRPQLIE